MNLYTNEKAIAKYWSNVNVAGIDDCWPWLGRQKRLMPFENPIGRDKAMLSTTKMMYSLVMDEVPSGRTPSMINLCGNDRCLNPTHYELKVNQ